MNVKRFISNYREAFGEKASLPIVFRYTNQPVAQTEKIGGCFFKGLQAVRQGRPISLNAAVIGCMGGQFYTGFSEMPERVPEFVSFKEKYKETPEMVINFIEDLEVTKTDKKYLDFVRIDQVKSLEDMEGLLFFATPDMLSGLCSWAFYDNNAPDTVTAMFGSGCSSVVACAVQENRRKGYRTFIGLLDPSVRPHVSENELGFVIPYCRFEQMSKTMRKCCLFATHAWGKVKERMEK